MKTAHCLVLALLFPLACSRSDDAFDDETIVDTASALLAYGTKLWPMKDDVAKVRVCWKPLNLGNQTFPVAKHAPDLDQVMIERRQWIQEAVEQQWNAKTVVKFVGWKPCGTEPVDVEVAPISSDVTVSGCSRGQSCSDGFGTGTRGKRVHINVLFGDETLYIAHYKREAGWSYDPQKTPQNVFAPALCLPEARNLAEDLLREQECRVGT